MFPDETLGTVPVEGRCRVANTRQVNTRWVIRQEISYLYGKFFKSQVFFFNVYRGNCNDTLLRRNDIFNVYIENRNHFRNHLQVKIPKSEKKAMVDSNLFFGILRVINLYVFI